MGRSLRMKKTKLKRNKRKDDQLQKKYYSVHYLLYPVLALVTFVALFSNVKPNTFDVKLFNIADQTIYAPITVVDEEMTKKKQEEAVASVEDQYVLNKEYADNSISMVESIFDSIIEISQSNLEDTEETISEEEKLNQLQEALASEGYEKIPKDALTILMQANTSELNLAKGSVVTAVNTIMSEPITVEKVTEARAKVREELQYVNLSNNLIEAAAKIGEIAIIPNYTFDVEATEEKRRQAMEEVQDVQIKQGQIIVEEGQLIDREVYRKLELLGLLDNKYTFQPFIGLTLLILLMVALIAYYIEKEKSFYISKQQTLLLYTIIFSITLLIMKMISLFQKMDYNHIGFIVPVSMGVMLIKLLINGRIAFISSLIFAICGSLIFNDDIASSFHFIIGLYYLCSCIAAVLFLGGHNVRSKILQAGIFVSFVNIIVITAVIFIQNGNTTNLEIGSYFVMAAVSGVVSSVLTIGFMPFFESGFGILSTMKMIELSNPNHPLLRKILTDAPGTYHHSVMVANLAESACEAIGANGFLARVGSYYHDIGKTRRPHYFIENQMNMENPHNKLSAQLSKNIIISHTTEGAEMLRKHKMPKEFIDIAEQHHGTSLLKYFYHKATENSEQEVLEEEFRYPGPKPQTREVAVIMIADSVEAAVRSLKNPTPDKIEKLVNSIIKDKIQDGQFDECDITFKELDIVAKSLCETLKGIFHSRIEYPELTEKKVKPS